jgi:hypothetical protein
MPNDKYQQDAQRIIDVWEKRASWASGEHEVAEEVARIRGEAAQRAFREAFTKLCTLPRNKVHHMEGPKGDRPTEFSTYESVRWGALEEVFKLLSEPPPCDPCPADCGYHAYGCNCVDTPSKEESNDEQ